MTIVKTGPCFWLVLKAGIVEPAVPCLGRRHQDLVPRAFIKNQLVNPLHLSRMYLTNPSSNFSDAVIPKVWEIELGDEAP